MNDIQIRRLISEIMIEWNMENHAYELMIRANLLKIFVGILRYWRKNEIDIKTSDFSDIMKKALKIYCREL